MTIRWIGFDMDECIGSVMPLFEYIHVLPLCVKGMEERATLFLDIANTLYDSEKEGRTWLIRPAMMSVVADLWRAIQQKKIEGAFIYSNNSGAALVNFVGFLLNVFAQRSLNLPSIPQIFRMAMWNGAPCRRRYGLVKSFESIQTCLSSNDLPICSSSDDLLFFDDMDHVLRKEITHYVQVKPYLHHTPSILIIHVLSPISKRISCTRWAYIGNSSMDNQIRDFSRPDNRYQLIPPLSSEAKKDLDVFSKSIREFVDSKK